MAEVARDTTNAIHAHRRTQQAALILFAVSLSLFIALAFQVNRLGAVAEFDESVGTRFRDHRQAEHEVRRVVLVLTEVGSVATMTTLALLTALLMIHRRCYWMALLCLVIPGGGALLNQGIKAWVDRPRPEFKDAAVPEVNESYPSGHSMGSLIGYGMIGYLLLQLLPRRRVRIVLLAALVSLVLAIGFSRIYLGAHFFSDVVGGYALGTAWLVGWISVIELRTRRTYPEAGARA